MHEQAVGDGDDQACRRRHRRAQAADEEGVIEGWANEHTMPRLTLSWSGALWSRVKESWDLYCRWLRGFSDWGWRGFRPAKNPQPASERRA